MREFAGTYQNSAAPIIALPTTRIGAPLSKAPSLARVPTETPTSAAPAITVCKVSSPPWL